MTETMRLLVHETKGHSKSRGTMPHAGNISSTTGRASTVQRFNGSLMMPV